MSVCSTSSFTSQADRPPHSDINRINASDLLASSLTRPKPRIVILSVTDDASGQYVPIMNCIFSAQKAVRTLDSQLRSTFFCAEIAQLCRIYRLTCAKYTDLTPSFYNKRVILLRVHTIKSREEPDYYNISSFVLSSFLDISRLIRIHRLHSFLDLSLGSTLLSQRRSKLI